jgi:hypothetical protein
VNDSLREILVADLPPAFVTRFQEAAAWAYREAWERIKNDTSITDEGRNQLLPHLRRVLVEAKLQNIALDSGVRAESEPVSSGAHKYVAVRVGRLVMTCSKTSGRNAVPRACDFRGQYSDVNEHIDQQNLFPIISTPGRESLYCIIVHGPSAQEKGELGFCCFGFPSPDSQRWVQEPIALADIRDYQQTRYQKSEDERAQIQPIEPKLKPEFGADSSAAEESA